MRWLVVSLVIGGCANTGTTVGFYSPGAAPAPASAPRLPQPPIPSDHIVAEDILLAADHLRADAYDYVARKQSKPSDIDQMTSLTRDLNVALAVMQAHCVRGRCRPVDMRAVRHALEALRRFLTSVEEATALYSPESWGLASSAAD